MAVSLTELGRQLLADQQEWLRGRQRAFYASLPPAERELAPDLLLRLAALIDELACRPDGVAPRRLRRTHIFGTRLRNDRGVWPPYKCRAS